jgi:hypothetical protein
MRPLHRLRAQLLPRTTAGRSRSRGRRAGKRR